MSRRRRTQSAARSPFYCQAADCRVLAAYRGHGEAWCRAHVPADWPAAANRQAADDADEAGEGGG